MQAQTTDSPHTPASRLATAGRRLSAAALLSLALVATNGTGIATAARVAHADTLYTSVVAAPGAVSDTASSVDQAIQDVIRRGNEAQVRAIATGDTSAMAATATSAYLQQLVQTNRGLSGHGVTGIALLGIDFGPISVNGATASASALETWSTTYGDGTVEVSRDPNEYTLVRQGDTWKIQDNTHPQATAQNTSAPAPTTSVDPSLAPTRDTSHNWSGYAASGTSYTSVSGTWVVPEFRPDSGSGMSAAWVGIGGVQTHDLIQAGTQQTVSGSGSTTYSTWVELLPAASRQVPLAVHPGDSVTVTIHEVAPNSWVIDLANNTTGQTYQDKEQYASSHSSVEWVQEAPSSMRGGLVPLDDFGTVQFTGGSATKDGQSLSIAATGAQPITMIGNGSQPLAIPTGIGADGSSFTVARVPGSVLTAPLPSVRARSGSSGGSGTPSFPTRPRRRASA